MWGWFLMLPPLYCQFPFRRPELVGRLLWESGSACVPLSLVDRRQGRDKRTRGLRKVSLINSGNKLEASQSPFSRETQEGLLLVTSCLISASPHSVSFPRFGFLWMFCWMWIPCTTASPCSHFIPMRVKVRWIGSSRATECLFEWGKTQLSFVMRLFSAHIFYYFLLFPLKLSSFEFGIEVLWGPLVKVSLAWNAVDDLGGKGRRSLLFHY